jgi:NitT/TauT family transport system substrate-binding protein
MVMDTFGCTPAFLAANDDAAKALTKSYFEAVAMIKADQAKAYGIMGADVKQTGEQFGKSAGYLRWADAEGNKAFFSGEWQAFTAKAADLLLEIGLIKAKPEISSLVETKYVAGGAS